MTRKKIRDDVSDARSASRKVDAADDPFAGMSWFDRQSYLCYLQDPQTSVDMIVSDVWSALYEYECLDDPTDADCAELISELNCARYELLDYVEDGWMGFDDAIRDMSYRAKELGVVWPEDGGCKHRRRRSKNIEYDSLTVSNFDLKSFKFLAKALHADDVEMFHQLVAIAKKKYSPKCSTIRQHLKLGVDELKRRSRAHKESTKG